MRPEHEGRSSARTARSGAVEFGSGPPLAGSGLDVAASRRRKREAGRRPRARTSRRRWLRLADVRQLLLLWPVCTGKRLAAATSLLPGGLKNPSRGAPPLLWPDPILAVGSFGRGWTRRLVQRTTVPWRRVGASHEPT
ncbi:hypothetical protein EE612_017879 [Oryza sativa]|nr:hypothetical protein EE612_017879 [Oryza sativa]